VLILYRFVGMLQLTEEIGNRTLAVTNGDI